MDTGEQLIDHLEGSALTSGVAQLVDLGRHRVECRPGFGKRSGAAGGKNRERAFGRALSAAADGRIEIVAARRLQTRGEFFRHLRVHRGRGKKHGALRHRVRHAIVAKENGLGLRRVDHNRNNDVGIVRRFCRRLRTGPAIRNKARDIVLPDVTHGEFAAGVAQRGRHAKSHRTQTDDGDAGGGRTV